jgi:PQQ-dependent catabolism-associated CXXCW motif protein
MNCDLPRWCRPFVCSAALFLALSHAVVVADEADFDATTGFRIARYRTPVPDKVPGGRVITAAEVADLVQSQQAILLDVMPSDGAGLDAVTGEWHMAKQRLDIPGSIWLPDVGRGNLTPSLDAYFRDNLAKLTSGNVSRPVIVYCQADCWMSWNAVKRASGYGYTALYWYPEGSDGWRDWDGSFADAKPVPVQSPVVDKARGQSQ